MEIKRIDRKQIIEELKEKGYGGKSISYKELQELYQEYGLGMTESDFAQTVLDVSYDSYIICKNKGKRARVLKDKQIELSQNEISKIIEDLKKKGYIGKAITYEELQELHREYGKGMLESDFAQTILGISFVNYYNCKHEITRTVRVSKDKKIELSHKEIENIIDKLKERGYKGKSISYEELQKLHREYGNGMLESDFAQTILGVKLSNYYNCKCTGIRVKVLKDKQIELAQEEIEKIIGELKKKGYQGKAITYEELQELYREYGNGILESKFAQAVLGISYGSYNSCKNKGTRARVLKDKQNKLSQEIEKIIEQLKEKGYKGKLITYGELQKLHIEYGNGMLERDFAQTVLKVSYNNYNVCKNKGRRVRILKDKQIELPQEEIEKIIEEIKKKGYKGKAITYEELQELYKQYGSGMLESKFAQAVLGISRGNYDSCKNKGTRARVLKDKKLELPQEQIEEIIEELKKKGYKGKSISYEELQKLHIEYGNGILESDFAQTILGVPFNTYSNLKYAQTPRIRILKDKKIELPEEESKKIIEELKRKGYIGKAITYEELQELHREYGKGMRERDFARTILGISSANYSSCKYNGQNAIIKHSIVNEKTKEIRELYVNKPDYYSKEFIINICKEYDISIEDFIIYVVVKGFYDISDILEILDKNNRLWIGKTRLSEEFANKNIDLIKKVASKMVNSLWSKYGKKGEKEDYEQDIIIYIIENMGEEERNFGENLERFQERVYVRTNRYCEGMIVQNIRATSRMGNFTRISKKGETDNEFEIQIKDDNVDVEKQVIESEVSFEFIEESDRCIKLLSQHIEEGCDREEAIAMTAEEMNIDASTMLEYMKQYLITKGKVKITKKGQVDWGVK